MHKTYYISMDNGHSFKRFTRNEERFLWNMWRALTAELYPLGRASVCRNSIEITILEPKGMREISTYDLQPDTTLGELWRHIQEMWRDIEHSC